MTFAIKKVRLLQGNADAYTHVQNECYAASKLQKHNNIVQLFEKSEHALVNGKSGDREVYLLYELCPGTSFFWLLTLSENDL